MKNLYLFLLALLPLAANAQYPLISLDTLQRVPAQQLAQGNDASLYLGDTVQFQGVVSMDPCLYALSQTSRKGTFVQTDPNQPWAAMHVLIDPGAIGYSGSLSDLNDDTKYLDNFKIGNKVRATGIVTAFSGLTQIALLPVASTIQGLGAAPTPKMMTIDSFNQSDGAGGQLIQYVTGEPNENMLVEFQNITVVDVVNTGNGRFNWAVQDAQGNQMPIRDVSGHFRNDNNDDHCNGFGSGTSVTPNQFTPPSLGSNLTYIRGIIFEYNGLYYLAPRTPSDVGPLVAAPPVVSDVARDPAVPTSSQTVDISAKIIDPDGTVASAELFYSFGQGNTSFTNLPMTSIGNDRYEATIPASGTDGEYVNFWFRAIDNSNDTTDAPFENATTQFYITLDDGIDEISDIQETPNLGGNSIWNGDTITSMSVNAVVTATLNTYDLGLLTIQDGTGPWSGIMLQKVPGDMLETLNRGDSIEITSAVVTEVFGVTYLTEVTFNHLGTGTIPPPVTTLDVDSLNQNVFEQAEAYESMLVRWAPATVVNTNADAPSNFGEFVINPNSGSSTGLRVDDYSQNIPFGFNDDSISQGQTLTYVQGILWYSFGNVKLVPRNLADIGGFSTTYPKSINTFAFLGLNPQLFMDINDTTLEISNDPPLPAGTDVTALVPTIDFSGVSINPGDGVAQDFSSPVDYTVTAPIDGSTVTYTVTVNVAVGIEETMPIAATVFPNPATNEAHVILRSDEAGTLDVQITNMLGQTVRAQQVTPSAGLTTFPLNISGLESGVYLVAITNGSEKLVKKLQIAR